MGSPGEAALLGTTANPAEANNVRILLIMFGDASNGDCAFAAASPPRTPPRTGEVAGVAFGRVLNSEVEDRP